MLLLCAMPAALEQMLTCIHLSCRCVSLQSSKVPSQRCIPELIVSCMQISPYHSYQLIIWHVFVQCGVS